MRTITRRGFLAGLACAQAISAHAGATAHGYRTLYPRTYDDGLIPRFSFEVREMSLGGRLGAHVLDLETGRTSSWSSNAEFDATPVAGPTLIAAAQWAVAEDKLQGTGRYSTYPAAGASHRAAPDDLCSSMAAAPDPATTAALHKILADRQLLSGFLRHLDGGRKEPESATAGVISCAAEPSVAATPRDIVESLKYVFSMVGNGSAHQLLRQNAWMSGPDRALLPGYCGRHLSARQISRLFKQAALAVGITKPVTQHTLRHSFATYLLERGVGIRIIYYPAVDCAAICREGA